MEESKLHFVLKILFYGLFTASTFVSLFFFFFFFEELLSVPVSQKLALGIFQ